MMDKYFDYRKHKTDFKTEVIAGVSTFLTMAYIMFLNPVILADGGFDFGGVFTATVLATALACFIAAFYAKTWPVGLAPGMGINAFVAYGVCLGMGKTPAEALGAVLVAGVVFLIISLTPIRAWLINSIPKSLKLGIGAGIGLFLAIIGFEIMGLTSDHPVTLVTLGNLSNPLTLLGAGAFISMIVMEKMKIKGNIIIGIIAFSVIAWLTGLAQFNGVASAPPPMTHLFTFDLGAALSASMATVIFTLFFIDFFDTAGTYPYLCMVHPWMQGTIIVGESSPTEDADTVPPTVLVPDDITLQTEDQNGASTTFNPQAIDNIDELITPTCSPASGSVFAIGTTEVVCTATDSSGNTASNSFNVIIEYTGSLIPSWVKNVAGFWHDGSINDASFLEGISYLIQNDIIIVPTTEAGSGGGAVPDWVKNTAGWWANDEIDDDTFVNAITYLIQQGLIQV